MTKTISRQTLYAMGEPIGDSCTRIEGGRRIYGFGGGGSSSSTQSTTQNTDKRIAIQDGIGISSDSSTVNVTSLDAGIVTKALDTVNVADAANSQGFTQLLGLADKLFTGAGQTLQTAQSATLAQVGALNQAQNDARGTIDQKTLIIIAVAGAAAYAYSRKK